MSRWTLMAIAAGVTACSSGPEYDMSDGTLVANPAFETESWRNPFIVDSVLFGGKKTLVFMRNPDTDIFCIVNNTISAMGELTLPDGQILKATGSDVRITDLGSLGTSVVLEFPHIDASTEKFDIENNQMFCHGIRLQKDNQTLPVISQELRDRCATFSLTEPMPKVEWIEQGEVTISGKLFGVTPRLKTNGVEISIYNPLMKLTERFHAELDEDTCFSIKVPVHQTFGMGEICMESGEDVRSFVYEAGKEIIFYADNTRVAHVMSRNKSQAMEHKQFVICDGALKDINNVLTDNRMRHLWQREELKDSIETYIANIKERLSDYTMRVNGLPNASDRAKTLLRERGKLSSLRELLIIRNIILQTLYRQQINRDFTFAKKRRKEMWKEIAACVPRVPIERLKQEICELEIDWEIAPALSDEWSQIPYYASLALDGNRDPKEDYSAHLDSALRGERYRDLSEEQKTDLEFIRKYYRKIPDFVSRRKIESIKGLQEDMTYYTQSFAVKHYIGEMPESKASCMMKAAGSQLQNTGAIAEDMLTRIESELGIKFRHIAEDVANRYAQTAVKIKHLETDDVMQELSDIYKDKVLVVYKKSSSDKEYVNANSMRYTSWRNKSKAVFICLLNENWNVNQSNLLADLRGYEFYRVSDKALNKIIEKYSDTKETNISYWHQGFFLLKNPKTKQAKFFVDYRIEETEKMLSIMTLDL